MKKNWMQGLSLALNIALVCLVIGQGVQLTRLHETVRGNSAAQDQEIQRLREQLADLRQELREGEKLVADYTLEPVGIDAENRTLEANLVLQLKSWSADSTVALKAAAYRETCITMLPVNADGSCRGNVMIPLEPQSGGLTMEAAVTSGGVTTREDLGSWEDPSMLLPLRAVGSSWSGPYYQDGKLKSDFDIILENACRTEVIEPQFRIYLNGALAQETAAEISQSTGTGREDRTVYAPALPEQTLLLDCRTGDTVRITFACRDGYGLGYEFPVQEWVIEETQANQAAGGVADGYEYPTLTWPE